MRPERGPVGAGCEVTYLEAWPQTVGVVTPVTAVTQQHVVGVSFASADATASVEDGARPADASFQTGQVDEHLDAHTSTLTVRVSNAVPTV